jgi:hypothetical protein
VSAAKHKHATTKFQCIKCKGGQFLHLVSEFMSESQGHYTMGKKPLQEMLSAAYFIKITFCFISETYKVLRKDDFCQ